jgi:hypothetical protein
MSSDPSEHFVDKAAGCSTNIFRDSELISDLGRSPKLLPSNH